MYLSLSVDVCSGITEGEEDVSRWRKRVVMVEIDLQSAEE